MVTIPAGRRAPGEARRFVARHLTAAPPATHENALLIVSELVTNGVRHSGAADGDDLIVRIRAQPRECWLEVEDPGREGAVALQANGPGLGLGLVEHLSDEWGFTQSLEGTRVWARLVTGHRSPTVVVERVSAYAVLDPGAEAELAEARQRAQNGDSCWAEWLADVDSGRALVILLEIEVILAVDGVKQRVSAKSPGVWLELDAHPPLVERQVQEAAAVSLSRRSRAIGMPLGVDLPEADMASMSVHAELDDAIRARLPAPGDAG